MHTGVQIVCHLFLVATPLFIAVLLVCDGLWCCLCPWCRPCPPKALTADRVADRVAASAVHRALTLTLTNPYGERIAH